MFELPVIKCWPHDGDPTAFGYPVDKQEPGGGRYITFGGIYTIHPEDAGKEGSDQVPLKDVANYTFEDYGFALVVLGLLLASAIIAGTFLAEEEMD